MEGFSDNGAHHYFGQADFFMPELLLKNIMPSVFQLIRKLTNLSISP